MPISGQDTNNNSGMSASNAFAGTDQTASQSQQQTQSQQPTQEKFSWNRLGTYSGHTMSRSPIGETLSKTVEALKEVLTTQKNENYDVRLIPMDMKDFSMLPASVILVTLRDKKITTPAVAVHILILEGSIEPWPAKSEMINGVSVEVQYPTSEAYKAGVTQAVEEELQRLFPNAKLLLAEGEVVPRTFNTEDKNRVYDLAANSLLAVESRLFELQGRSELNLANASNDASLSVRVNFLSNQPQQMDSVGLPLRSDVELSIISTTNNQNTQQYGQQLLERQRDLGYVTGYVDTIWDPLQQSNGYGQPQMAQFGNMLAPDGSALTAKIRPVFVITDSRMREVSSLTAQIMSLFPALYLRENNQWKAAFRPRATADGIDMKNVGALNVEVNLPIGGQQPDASGRGPIIDIGAANFTPENFEQYMQATFRNGLGIAVDVPECGSSTWYNVILQAIAIGNKEAYDLMYDATDFLTNRHFSKLFPRNEAIAQHFSVIHNGWYLDAKGQQRDIRDFDLVALLNHPIGEDRQVVDAYINSYQNTNVPIKVRLSDRFRIIQKALGEVHLTGFSNRVFLTDKYLTAALTAAGQAGLVLRPQNQLNDQGIGTRASANLNAGLFGMGGGQTVFNNNMMNAGPAVNNFAGFGGSRFGWSR